ncbi:MAG: lipopolysaccharide biosynthesis protein [Bacillota bacterium]|nr:lipopolysaccharide biosynthesis protein [Bacillota bacterium]
MLALIRTALNRTNNISRSTCLWNAVNAGLSAALCPVILMVMNRTNGVDDAGMFAIAFAVAALMLFVGQYGLRRFQSSDIYEKYTVPEYHGMRFVTCGAMLIASTAYCFYGVFMRDYTLDKFLVILLICLLKENQAYADVVHGHMQQKGRLDVAAKASAVRFFAELASCCIALILTRSLLIATVICLVTSTAVLLLTTINAARDYCDTLRPSLSLQKCRQLLIDGFPLFASLFLNMYISNAAKYAIDQYLTDDVQAYYNYIFMPAFVIQLIAYFIFNPILTTYARLWLSEKKEDLKRLRSLIRRQCVLLLGLTALAVLVAFTIGIPVLSFMFGVNLGAYRDDLCLLMAGGGLMAYGVFFNYVITIIREQKYLLISYGITFIAARVLAGFFVTRWGITGAVILYTVLMAVLAVMLGIITLWKVRGRRIELTRP